MASSVCRHCGAILHPSHRCALRPRKNRVRRKGTNFEGTSVSQNLATESTWVKWDDPDTLLSDGILLLDGWCYNENLEFLDEPPLSKEELDQTLASIAQAFEEPR